jgi:hypothetical protein
MADYGVPPNPPYVDPERQRIWGECMRTSAAGAYFNQPRRRKYQNGAMALVTISTMANG